MGIEWIMPELSMLRQGRVLRERRRLAAGKDRDAQRLTDANPVVG